LKNSSFVIIGSNAFRNIVFIEVSFLIKLLIFGVSIFFFFGLTKVILSCNKFVLGDFAFEIHYDYNILNCLILMKVYLKLMKEHNHFIMTLLYRVFPFLILCPY
jgi:hypothetical protein